MQEIFVPPAPQPGGGRGNEVREKLWSAGEVQGVELPLGVSLRFEDGTGRDRTLETGDACEEEACAGMKEVLLEQDVLVGLRQMRESSESRSLSASRWS